MAAVDDFEDTIKELKTTTTRKNRQTQIEEKIDVQARLRCINGILSLEVAENNVSLEPANKTAIHKLKRHVIEDILDNLCGYDDFKKNKINKGKLEMILCAICGIEEHPETVVNKIFDSKSKKQILDLLEQEKMVLTFDVFEGIKKDKDSVLSITSFMEDSFRYLHSKHYEELQSFIDYIWNALINIWLKYPTDEKFIGATVAFTKSYYQCAEYQALQKGYTRLQKVQAFNFNHIKFSTFAYGLWIVVKNLFISEIGKNVALVLLKVQTNNDKGKKLNAEETYYLNQSVGGATANSRYRVYYGGNYNATARAMLVSHVGFMLVTKDEIDNAKIAFRLKIENRGHLRILKEEFTLWVGQIMEIIKPKLHNLVLKYKGDFHEILEELLENKSLKKSFCDLFDCDTVLQSFYAKFDKNNNMDIDIDMDSETIIALYIICQDKVFDDFVAGVTNRYIWGYLKQLKPDKDNLSLRNKLKLSLSTSKKKYSSLQIDQE